MEPELKPQIPMSDFMAAINSEIEKQKAFKESMKLAQEAADADRRRLEMQEQMLVLLAKQQTILEAQVSAIQSIGSTLVAIERAVDAMTYRV